MKKLSLELNNLAVESFVTAESTEIRGTVNGHDNTEYCYSQGVCEPWTQNPSDAHCTHTHVAQIGA